MIRVPFIQVNLLEGRDEKQREKLAKAITDAVVEILGVPRDRVWILFNEMRRTHFATGGILKSKT